MPDESQHSSTSADKVENAMQLDVRRSAFEWPVYADATAAGLASLIPIPGIDWLIRQFFRRRIPQAIASYRRVDLQPDVNREILRTETGCARSCLLLPLLGAFWLLKVISKKILYFLTVKEAADRVSWYWHEAFLIDLMLSQGHLDNRQSAATARQAMQQVITNSHASPVYRLAFEVVRNRHRIGKILVGILRGKEPSMSDSVREQVDENWNSFQAYFSALAALYMQAYRANQIDREI